MKKPKTTNSERLYILNLLKPLFVNEGTYHMEIVVSRLNYIKAQQEPLDFKIPNEEPCMYYDLIRSDTKEILYTFYWTPSEYRVYLKWRHEDDE